MKPVSSPLPQTAGRPAGTSRSAARGEEWAERAGRLYMELERPARALIRRAYRGAFSDDELDDLYSGAWVGTLRALQRRQAEMADEEIGRYLLAAVANQASKEMRRRRRKPTAPLDLVETIPDDAGNPDEHVVGAETSRITRDLLASLPTRRRAVMYLRYGWGLPPSQVRELIDGLSPRAYRKEITRGVDELADRMRRFERGEWCEDREPLLKAYATGLADQDQRRQAQAHLSHCTECSDFVARLGSHLHDIGAAVSLPAAVDALAGRPLVLDRIGEASDRLRDAIGGLLARGGGDGASETAGQVIAAGGSRGIGATAGAGVLAKLGGLGTAGKIAVACLSGGAAATACVTAGVLPGALSGGGSDRERSAPLSPGRAATDPPRSLERKPDEAGSRPERPATPSEQEADADPPPVPEPPPPVAPSTPPVEQEFGVAAAAGSGGGGGAAASGSGGGGGGAGAVRREFGP